MWFVRVHDESRVSRRLARGIIDGFDARTAGAGGLLRRVHDDAHADLRLVSRAVRGHLFERTFHRDGPRILDNIKSFKEAKVDRVIFLAPEGAIVDPGVEKDAEYVQQCSKFMLDHDRRPLKYLLTPRYKGMQLVTTHNPEGISLVSRWPSSVGTRIPYKWMT